MDWKKGVCLLHPIQALALPVLLSGQDIAGQAQTGTGKTLAFLTATFNHLLTTPAAEGRAETQPRAIIMAPTRELAIQIFNDAEPLLASTGLKAALAYGGESYDKQLAKLQSGVDILIGTTGRIIDFYKQRVFNLNHIQAVVLDEADRMFDLGFIKDIRFLFRRMPEPKDRLNMLFSATLSYRVQELAFEHMNNPEHVVVEPEQKPVIAFRKSCSTHRTNTRWRCYRLLSKKSGQIAQSFLLTLSTAVNRFGHIWRPITTVLAY